MDPVAGARFAEIVGYTQDELPSLTFQQITAPEDLDSSAEVLGRISSGALAAS